MATTTAIGIDATDLNAVLQAAMAGSYVAQGSGRDFTVSKTIVIHVDSTTQGPLGLDLGGGTIHSNITDGSPVIQVIVGPGVDLRYLQFANLTIDGNGREGSGIQILAGANERWVYNFGIENVTVNHVGGYGLDMQGSVFEGLISNSWMTNNGKGGAYFAHLNDGQASALHWFGGGLLNNDGPGMMLDKGVRDMSVDGVKFVGNQDGGISAEGGITSVSNSHFEDNKGQGIWFQNYGNFTDNTFETSGTQSVGITGWQNGGSTVVGNVSTWTGSGADPTTLANLQGYGSVYATGDTGKVVTGSSLSVSGLGGGNETSVTVSSSGVAQPALSAVTSATTAALATTNTGHPVETALKAAVANGSVHLTDATYTVSSPIVINLTNASQGPIDIDFGGAKIQSNVTNGGPVIEIIVGAGVNVSELSLSHLMINGNGREGDGIKIVADGTDRSVNLKLDSVNVEHVGGIGLDVVGNVHADILNSWMNGNTGGGARFANGPNGGVAEDLSWIGGGFRKNPVAGLILDNGARDMSVKGAYFVENEGVGIVPTSGITLVKESGFENNGGTAIVTNGSANVVSDTFSTWGAQNVAVGGRLNGGTVNMSGIDKEYYGSGADTTLLANLQGNGKLAVAGNGAVVAGPNISVTGSTLTASGTPGVPADTGGGGTDPGDTPVLTEMLASDTGSSATDKITSNARLSGTADVDATVKIAIDGTQVATTTADSAGKWSYRPSGLSDGQHTVVASETNAAGKTGSASLTFTLDTTAPSVTAALAGGGTSTGTGALTGTAERNAVIKFTIDGAPIAGTATADATGMWSYTPNGLAAGSHTVVATATDAAGNSGSASLAFTMTTGGGTPTGTTPVFTGATFVDNQLTVTGTTPTPGSTVWIYDGSNWVGAVTSDAAGNFSFSEAAVTGSAHSFGAIAIDPAGITTKTTTAYAYTAGISEPPPTDTGGELPSVTARLLYDDGASSTDRVTTDPTLKGIADPNAVIHFTVDGINIAATATANSKGVWSYTPTGLGDGAHTIVASETDAAGHTGSASVSFTLNADGPIPIITKGALSAGVATIAGTTGEAHSTVSVYDGDTLLGTTTSGSDGSWTFTASASSDVAHSYGASASDSAGHEAHGINAAIFGSAAGDRLKGAAGSDIVNGGAGNDRLIGSSGADKLKGGSGSDTFKYTATSDSTASASDTIAGFQHGVDKIDFTAIAGISASNGTPTFQGYLSGTGNVTLNAHSVAVMEVGGNTQVLVNTSSTAETVTATDTHAADMKITLVGVNLGITANDFHHN